MKTRHVYSTPDLAVAHAAMDAARRAGVADEDVSLVARSDIELQAVPDDRKVVEGDFYPAAIRGIGGGAVIGLLAGLVAMVIPPLDLTLAGVAVTTLAGAAVGGWTTALAALRCRTRCGARSRRISPRAISLSYSTRRSQCWSVPMRPSASAAHATCHSTNPR